MKIKEPKRITIMMNGDERTDQAIRMFAGELGYECDSFADYSDIYRAFDTNHYDAAWCDIHIPGFDLPTFLNYCEKRFPYIIFVVIGNEFENGEERYYQEFQNVVDCLIKPIQFSDFARQMKDANTERMLKT